MKKLVTILGLITFFIFFSVGFVDGDSMNPTLSNTDFILISRFTSPVNDDIIVFNLDNQRLIKRVVASNGENYNGYVSLGEYYVLGDNIDESYDSRSFGTIKNNQISGVVVFHCSLTVFIITLLIFCIILYCLLIK
jgi:signal peptidase I